MTRRSFVPALTGAMSLATAAGQDAKVTYRPGTLKQAICPGALGRAMSLEDKCKEVARLGLYGIDLLGPKDWPTLKKYGLIPTMSNGGMTIRDGINKVENHAGIESRLRELIDQ